MKMKYRLFRSTEAEGIYCQQTCSKGSHLEQRAKMK